MAVDHFGNLGASGAGRCQKMNPGSSAMNFPVIYLLFSFAVSVIRICFRTMLVIPRITETERKDVKLTQPINLLLCVEEKYGHKTQLLLCPNLLGDVIQVALLWRCWESWMAQSGRAFDFTRRPPRWPSGKASTSRAEDHGFESRLRRDFFRGRVIPVTSKLALQWLPCQAPGVIGSALGLVGPVSAYCDWVRWEV